jgi:hypothetical protein
VLFSDERTKLTRLGISFLYAVWHSVHVRSLLVSAFCATLAST